MVDEKFINYPNIEHVQFFNTEPKDLKSWNSTLNIYKELNNICEKIGAKFILLYIPSRASIYYERAFGEKLNNKTLKEAKLLKNFASKNNFIFLDPSSNLKSYVDSLPKKFDLKELPYLEVDAHMNKIGHNIVSDVIINEIKKTY